jgi:cellobiose phosphorylase
MALSIANHEVAREHLLRAVSRQFTEGNAQHSWHPLRGRGVRSRISDDLLRLPYAVIQFLEATGDMAVLDEVVPYLGGGRAGQGTNRIVLPATRVKGRSAGYVEARRQKPPRRAIGLGGKGLFLP